MKSLYLPLIILLAALGLPGGAPRAQRAEGAPQQMMPAQKLGIAEKLIETYYVDTVEGQKLAETAIVAMLKTLDPHSSYSDPDETRELTQPLEGNFSGIGIQFNMLQDTLFVIQTTAGGPSEKVGILPGDRIIQAGDSVIAGRKLPNSRIIRTLRGPKGTRVDLKVLRRGVPAPLWFAVERDNIPVYSVDAAYMADPLTGYIRLSRFGEETDREFRQAVKDLKKQGMKQLILDLDDNGGGYLGAATALAGHFLRKGDMIVSTTSPTMGDHAYVAEADGDLLDMPLVVMANQYSASASEITAGAIQDNDRGLVVGRRTFGKGLVQRPFPFPDGSMIRLTVSKYLTPSGRSIQKPYRRGESEDYQKDLLNRYQGGEYSSADSIHYADSLLYHTVRLGRPIYGGGGISPDLFVAVDTTMYSPYYRDLLAKGILNRYAVTYVDDRRGDLRRLYPTQESFVEGFEVTDQMMRDMALMGLRDSVALDTAQYERSLPMMRTIVKGIIGRDLFEPGTYFRVVNPQLSPSYRQALDLINDRRRYDALLAPKAKES